MTNILDTVEPDAFVPGRHGMESCYSRETVESLLEAHRKQVLLEVIARAEKNVLPAISTYELLRMAEGEK
jgi:hypothetical protein